MNIIALTEEEYNAILKRLDSIDSKIEGIKNPAKKVYNGDEVCELLKISKRTLQTWRDTGIIKAVKIGRKILYSQNEIDRLLQSCSNSSR